MWALCPEFRSSMWHGSIQKICKSQVYRLQLHYTDLDQILQSQGLNNSRQLLLVSRQTCCSEAVVAGASDTRYSASPLEGFPKKAVWLIKGAGAPLFSHWIRLDSFGTSSWNRLKSKPAPENVLIWQIRLHNQSVLFAYFASSFFNQYIIKAMVFLPSNDHFQNHFFTLHWLVTRRKQTPPSTLKLPFNNSKSAFLIKQSLWLFQLHIPA